MISAVCDRSRSDTIVIDVVDMKFNWLLSLFHAEYNILGCHVVTCKPKYLYICIITFCLVDNQRDDLLPCLEFYVSLSILHKS